MDGRTQVHTGEVMSTQELERRCLVTHNLCGSDTWGEIPCPCKQCQIWILAASVKFEEAARGWEISAKSKQRLIARSARKNMHLRTALQRLINLKDYKDTEGKTEWYLEQQPDAWENARSVLK